MQNITFYEDILSAKESLKIESESQHSSIEFV
jgi:hypothetical protein